MPVMQSFSEEQNLKIRNRLRYVRKQKSDYIQLYSSTPCPQHLRLDALSIKTPQNIPPTPNTDLQHIVDQIEKKSGFTVEYPTSETNGVFQASAMESLQSRVSICQKARSDPSRLQI